MRWKATCIAALAACAPASASRAPLHYQPMKKPTSGSSVPAGFVPAEAAAPISLACRSAEPALANALDDDCDGRIDGVDDDAALLVALAYPRAAGLRFFFRAAADAPEQPIASPECNEPAPFCVLRIDTRALTHGRHDLWVASSDASADALPSSVLVSVRAEGKLASYLLRLEQPEPERLGQLSLP